MRDRWTMAVSVAIVTTLVAGAFWVYRNVVDAQAPSPEPVEPVWGKDVCAHCQMHVSEPAFAAQAQLPGGGTVFFDDPGCFFEWEREHAAPPLVWFHHVTKSHWIPANDVGFVAAEPTPMGFGLAAVEASEPGARSLAAARQSVNEEHHTGRMP